MPVKFYFDVVSTANNSMFLEPWRMMLDIRSIDKTVDDYEKAYEFPEGQSAFPMVPNILRDQIISDTGIENFTIKKYFFDRGRYIIMFWDPESYMLFKLTYCGPKGME